MFICIYHTYIYVYLGAALRLLHTARNHFSCKAVFICIRVHICIYVYITYLYTCIFGRCTALASHSWCLFCIHMCVYMYMCTYMYVCIYMYILYIYTYILYLYVHVYLRRCSALAVHSWKLFLIHICMYICICVHISIYVYIYICIYRNINYTHRRAHLTRVHIYMYICNIHTHEH